MCSIKEQTREERERERERREKEKGREGGRERESFKRNLKKVVLNGTSIKNCNYRLFNLRPLRRENTYFVKDIERNSWNEGNVL